ncbi:6-phosphogluconolactonase [Polaribacter staleyi]|uniref:6-phosphogluconolactonase n=1 Tax=Polaribacter staleyi TaxID=2022337 RepID=UPI0031BAD840
MQKIIYKSGKKDFDIFSANFLRDTIQKLLIEKLGIISIALSGGSTPIPILNILKNENIDWNRVSFYIVDERCVSLEDSQCNYNNINIVFFSNISSNSYSIITDGVSFKKSSENYQYLLNENLAKTPNGVPEFDLILLGMGEDGHTASLFPNTEALEEQDNFVVLNDVPQLATQRITLTYPVILAAKCAIVLCKGEKKEEIVENIYTNKGNSYPINKIAKEHSNIKWLIG